MTKGEFIKQIEIWSDKVEIVMSIDAEGNNFKDIDEVGYMLKSVMTNEETDDDERVLVVYPV